MRREICGVLAAGAILSAGPGAAAAAAAAASNGALGPSNPFYAASALPFHAPPFDKIKDGDYRAAIEAGMKQQLAEIQAITKNSAAPTFENTLIPLEKSGRLLDRSVSVFNAVTD